MKDVLFASILSPRFQTIQWSRVTSVWFIYNRLSHQDVGSAGWPVTQYSPKDWKDRQKRRLKLLVALDRCCILNKWVRYFTKGAVYVSPSSQLSSLTGNRRDIYDGLKACHFCTCRTSVLKSFIQDSKCSTNTDGIFSSIVWPRNFISKPSQPFTVHMKVAMFTMRRKGTQSINQGIWLKSFIL